MPCMNFLVLAKWTDIDFLRHSAWFLVETMEAAESSKHKLWIDGNDIDQFWVVPVSGAVDLCRKNVEGT
jgi:hypothetical protein